MGESGVIVLAGSTDKSRQSFGRLFDLDDIDRGLFQRIEIGLLWRCCFFHRLLRRYGFVLDLRLELIQILVVHIWFQYTALELAAVEANIIGVRGPGGRTLVRDSILFIHRHHLELGQVRRQWVGSHQQPLAHEFEERERILKSRGFPKRSVALLLDGTPVSLHVEDLTCKLELEGRGDA